MAHRVWVLVEWVDERNVFPSYGIVNVDLLVYNNTDISVGKMIYISVKYGNPRRAEILRMSADSKRYLKEHKEVLERQDQKVKNVLQLCMRTIKEMKSESHYLTSMNDRKTNIRTSQNSIIPHVTVKGETSATDSETEETEHINHSRVLHINNTVKYITPYNNKENDHHQNRSLGSPSNYQRPRIVTSSTPLPGGSIIGSLPLFTDKGTQTDTSLGQPPLDKIEEMETMLKSLYRRFHSLIAQVNNFESVCVSDLELNVNDASFVETPVNGSWVEHNNNQFGEAEQPREPNINDIGAEQIVEETGTQQKLNSSRVKVEQDKKNDNTLRVRRMSAQTTNNIENSPLVDSDMVPIGNGNATVPSRLLNEIDWNSHTAATRQLLQAVFPRKILATHSLTGKQSPAFTNKPPKKILDPKLVEDIVKTVSLRSGVPKNLVRNTITIKCTDEAKLYRTRQYRHARHTVQQHDENAPPSPASSDESLPVNN